MAARDSAAGAARQTWRAARWTGGRVRGQVVKRVGGPARARVITLFAGVLALSGADSATVGAMAPQLEKALHIGPTEIGLLSSVTLLVGAVFTIPVGLLVDRVKRMPLLCLSILLWSGASILGGLAGNYSDLLISRLLLGAVIATAGPAIASLTGDYFAADERGRVWAYILGGEIAGTAVGFILMGSIASLLSWRVSFILLAIPGFFLARSLYSTVPEPLRGGQNHLAPGAVELAPSDTAVMRAERGEVKEEDQGGELAREWARRRGIKPDPRLVLESDAASMSLVKSVKYILSIPTNLMMIISASLGYFYFQGLSTFALLFVRGHYHLGQAGAELILLALVLGALVGTLVSGRLTDILLHRGYLEVRVWIPAICYLAAGVLLIPGLVATSPTPAVWFDVGGAALLSAANPPLNAARLDIVPSGLWGRSQSTMTVVRSLAQALSPLLFGGLTSLIAGIAAPAQAPVGTRVHGVISPSEASGLEISFLVLLVTLIAAGLFQLRARKTYARDIATAAASEEAQTRRRRRSADPAPRQGWSGQTTPGASDGPHPPVTPDQGVG